MSTYLRTVAYLPMMSVFTLAVFFGVTAGHFLLVGRWLRLFAPAHRWEPAEFAFQTMAVGLGTLQAILHVLAFTVGLSFARGLVGIAVIHLFASLVLLARARRPAPVREQARTGDGPIGADAPRGVPLVSLAGVAIVTALVVQWIIVAAVSLEVVGTDADHYHIPNAVNIALGARAFGVPATPHLYPMGTSVLAAWFLLPLRDLLLVDLATLLPFLLAWFAITRLFAEVTGREGLAWGPPLALVLFATPLFRASLPMSADLFYTAAFLALNVLLLKACVKLRLDGIDVLSLALSLGMLLGSKATGVFSAVTLVGLYGVVTAGRCLFLRTPFSWTGLSATSAAAAVALIVASGGLWQVRNWWMFGSPIAPSGLSLLGVPLFPGTTYESGKYYGSVLRDVRDLGGYSAIARFAYWVKIWLGAWFLPVGLAVLVLVADIGHAYRKMGRAYDASRPAVVFVSMSLVLCVTHLLVLAGAPWSSLESYRGLSLRYALPCFALYGLAGYAACFSMAMPWWRRHPAPLAGALLALAAGWYIAHQDLGAGLVNLTAARLTPSGAGIAILALTAWLGSARLARGAARATARVALLALLAGAAAIYVAEQDSAQIAAAERDFASQAVSRDLANPYRDTYLAILADERATGTACVRRRLFITTRFDAPLDLQPPRFENELLESRVTFNLSRMRDERVGSEPCDYIIASRQELNTARGVYLLDLLKPSGSLRMVGQAGDYVVYAARNR